MERIPIAGPWITQKEIDYVSDAVRNAWYGNSNMYHERFEKAFADYAGVQFAMALPSCTSAIHLALMALNIGPGDEVIVPDITWIASAAPVTYVGASTVFADIDERTWCMSARSFEECVTPRTKAVIPVDLYGNMPDMDAILEIARKHGICVIEDAAQAIASEYRGKKAGSFGDAGVFSFHGSKTLSTGEGGMLLTDRQDLHRRALFLRDHGRQAGDKMFWNTEVAHKYKMSSMQAALGLAQLERISELIERKLQIFSWYQKELSAMDSIRLNFTRPDTKNTFWMVTVMVDPQLGLPKERLLKLLEERDIATRPFFYPLSSLPAYAKSEEAERASRRNAASYSISPYAVNLPSALILKEEQVKYVCDTLKAILRDRRGSAEIS